MRCGKLSFTALGIKSSSAATALGTTAKPWLLHPPPRIIYFVKNTHNGNRSEPRLPSRCSTSKQGNVMSVKSHRTQAPHVTTRATREKPVRGIVSHVRSLAGLFPQAMVTTTYGALLVFEVSLRSTTSLRRCELPCDGNKPNTTLSHRGVSIKSSESGHSVRLTKPRDRPAWRWWTHHRGLLTPHALVSLAFHTTTTVTPPLRHSDGTSPCGAGRVVAPTQLPQLLRPFPPAPEPEPEPATYGRTASALTSVPSTTRRRPY